MPDRVLNVPVGPAAQRGRGAGLADPLGLGVAVLAAASAAPTIDAALQVAVELLGAGLGCASAGRFKVSGLTRTHIAIVAGEAGGTAVPEELALAEAPGLALQEGNTYLAPDRSIARVAVHRDGQPIAGIELVRPALAIQPAVLAHLLEITRLALNLWSQHEPVQHAALGLPALSREFAEVIDDGLFISNPERSQFHFLTDSAYQTWGASRETIASRPEALLDVVIDADRVIVADRAQRERAGQACDVSFRIQHPTRGLRWLRSRTRSLPSPDGVPRVYGVVSDVTAEREHRADLERARDEAEAASRAKSQFMANMSHEIRTPMNGILGMTELLLGTPLSDQQRRFAQAVYASGESLLEIINDILDFAKIESGKLVLAPGDFMLRSVAEDTLELLAPRAYAKGLELSLLEQPGLPSVVHGDALRLRQVLTNLVANAIKFTEHGDVVVEIHRGQGTEPGAQLQLEFRVRDTGIGIERQALARLFSAFTQGHAGSSKRYGGTGLGLAIVRQLVELMGGSVTVQSAPGIGSEFTVSLPFKAAQARSGLGEPDSVDLAGLRVLVVDDNETNRCVLENMLGAWGMHVTLAVDGQDALEQLLAHPPHALPFDLALVDMQMPRLDGLQLAAALREAGRLPGLRMVMLSSASSADDARAAREAGFQRFVAKPVRRAELRRAIQGVAAAQREPVETSISLDGDVLVVEDNGVNRQVIDQMLKGLGCRPHLAAGAMEGLRALCEKRFDLVLMDIQMPGMDGIEALRCFRRGPGSRFAFVTPPDTPVVAVTANALAEDETRLRALGFDDYLAKPFRRGQLLAMLNHHLTPGAATPGPGAGTPPAAEPAAGAGSVMPSSDVLDTEALDRLRELDPKGENQLLQRVLTAFQTSIARLVPQVRDASVNGDLAGVRHVAHTLKSSSASIGATKLAQMCGEIESMIRLEKVESLEPRVAAMCAEIDTVLQALKQLLDDKR